MHAIDTKKGLAIQISKSHRKVNFYNDSQNT